MELLEPNVETRAVKALDAFRERGYHGLRDIAHEFNVPYSRLQRRRQGARTKAHTGGANKKLSEGQELALKGWITRVINLGFPPRVDLVRARANQLLVAGASSVETASEVGINWPRNFLDRCPEFKMRNSSQLEGARAAGASYSKIRGWFDRLEKIRQEYGIQDQDIYNVDETGFMTGQGHRTRVVSLSTTTPRAGTSIVPGQRTWITSIECICATGHVLSPLLILPGQMHLTTWYQTSMPSDWQIATSDTGWTNDVIGLHWLSEVFEPQTRSWCIGTHRLLIIDGHGSHVTAEFIMHCWEHRIIPVCLPPHTSHLLQPLDVSCFGPLKHYHTLAVNSQARTGAATLDKIEFLQQYPSVRRQAFTMANILSAFQKTGLVPSAPRIVLNHLSIDDRPATPPAPSIEGFDGGEFTTPRNARQCHLHAKQLLALVREDMDLDPDAHVLHRQIGRLAKAADCSFAQTALLKQEISDLQAANGQRATQASRRRGQLQDGGILRVEDAQAMLDERHAKEQEQQEKKQERARKQAEKQQQAQQRSQMLDPALGNASFDSMCSVINFTI